jgi:hypothetical protein
VEYQGDDYGNQRGECRPRHNGQPAEDEYFAQSREQQEGRQKTEQDAKKSRGRHRGS